MFPGRRRLQSTDPFVFDGPFLYACCRQVRKKDGVATSLQELGPGDVVLFGSHRSGSFLLDTVFVVADRGSERYQCNTGPEQLGANVPPSFVEATLKPLASLDAGHFGPCATSSAEAGACGGSSCDPDYAQFTLYRGATPENPVDGMFSYVPAKLAGDTIAWFEQPIVSDRVSSGLRQNFRDCLPGSADRRAVREAWTEIASSIIKNKKDKFVLGTYLWIA